MFVNVLYTEQSEPIPGITIIMFPLAYATSHYKY